MRQSYNAGSRNLHELVNLKIFDCPPINQVENQPQEAPEHEELPLHSAEEARGHEVEGDHDSVLEGGGRAAAARGRRLEGGADAQGAGDRGRAASDQGQGAAQGRAKGQERPEPA